MHVAFSIHRFTHMLKCYKCSIKYHLELNVKTVCEFPIYHLNLKLNLEIKCFWERLRVNYDIWVTFQVMAKGMAFSVSLILSHNQFRKVINQEQIFAFLISIKNFRTDLFDLKCHSGVL